MEWNQMLSIFATVIGGVATVIGLINSKSKSDKADAIQIKSLEMKIDNLIEKMSRFEQDMYSVVHNENLNSKEVSNHSIRIEALEARVKKLEAKLDSKNKDED